MTKETHSATKMAMLKRQGMPVEQIEEAIALSDELLQERFPGCLDGAIAVRERFRANGGDRIPRGADGKLPVDGLLVVTLATQAVIEVEGQRVLVEDLDDVRTETRLREVATMIGRAWAGQALIDWSTENWVAVIRFIKRNGPKGGEVEQILEQLLAQDEAWSPALLLSWQLARREAVGAMESPDYLLPEMRQQIEAALAEGEQEIRRIEAACAVLQQGDPMPSSLHIPGF
jgi:hypothetical protein